MASGQRTHSGGLFAALFFYVSLHCGLLDNGRVESLRMAVDGDEGQGLGGALQEDNTVLNIALKDEKASMTVASNATEPLTEEQPEGFFAEIRKNWDLALNKECMEEVFNKEHECHNALVFYLTALCLVSMFAGCCCCGSTMLCCWCRNK
mmetsp:Transcript_3610/g.6594  ORF Transcript_3610/g.6594 Transcript_3610/m.6594 type:complete len:150 (+) Transcript_3610:86-535(+)